MNADPFGHGGWTEDRLPELSGKSFLITGGNSGIGLEAARMLGSRGGRVVIACRNPQKAAAAVEQLRTAAPAGRFESISLDLASLASVRAAASEARSRLERIDALVNNAGIMMIPSRTLTADGFETQFGVNHLGHFLFAALLADRVEASSGRFVIVASTASNFAPGFRFSDLMFEKGYSPARVYARSKLANLSFALELDRRLAAAGAKARAYACHPGWSDTALQFTGPGEKAAPLFRVLNGVFSQTAALGALPTALCAAGLEAAPGGYYGPTGFFELKGPVGAAKIPAPAKDRAAAEKLWTISEQLTGADWSSTLRAAA